MKKIDHPVHAKIVEALRRKAGPAPRYASVERYLLSGHHYYGVSAPDRRIVAKEWLKERKDMPDKEFLAVVESLFRGESHEEKTLASTLLEYRPEARPAVTFSKLDSWLDELAGWAEIDSLCSGVFEAPEVLARWDAWEAFIRKLSKDKNINKRRAALVFLVKPVGGSSEKKVLDLAFETIDRLKGEKEIIITKAVSWVLRSGVKLHKKAIGDYVRKNADSLPKIAIRETKRKIETGRK